MGFKKERCRWKIILDVLTTLAKEKKAKKTKVMQKACLDWRNFKKYFVFLLDNGFIAECNTEEKNYEVTEKGMELLKRLKEVDEMLNRKL